jgi:hypothetical protein
MLRVSADGLSLTAGFGWGWVAILARVLALRTQSGDFFLVARGLLAFVRL